MRVQLGVALVELGAAILEAERQRCEARQVVAEMELGRELAPLAPVAPRLPVQEAVEERQRQKDGEHRRLA